MLEESKNSICAEKASEDDIENKDNANRTTISVMSDGCVMCDDDADDYVKIIDECSSDISKPVDIIDFDDVLASRGRYVPYRRHKWNARRIASVAAAAVAAIVFALPSIAFAASDRNAVDTGSISFEQIAQAIRDASTEDDDGAFNTVGYEEVSDRIARDVNGTPLSSNSKLEGRMDAAMYLDELATLRSGVRGETDAVVSELGEYVNDDAKAVLTSSENGMRNAMSITSYNEHKATFDAKVQECRSAKEEAERRAAEEAARRAAAAAAAAAARQQQQAVYSRGYSDGYNSSGASEYSSSWNPSYVTAYGSQASIDAGRTYLTEFAPGYFAGHRHFSVGQSIASHPQYVTVNGQKYQYAGTQNFANGSSLSAATGWAGTGSGNIAFQTCNNDGATVQVNKYVPVG